ncbi:hypothetical protein RHGRI_012888 [Rhododendron griersonianum]|uniref:Uncharacterized protein n=1 Tax=Rhododendron griersonianum TaxID=479676 RepID=A0AAV6K3R3_9ERIC|nr:hypothetical protein RHGRI_012888 [Rhododendron griersonianum]
MPRPKTGSSNPNPNPRVPILRLDPKMPLPMMNLPLLRFHGSHPRMPLCSTPLPELIDGRNFGKGSDEDFKISSFVKGFEITLGVDKIAALFRIPTDEMALAGSTDKSLPFGGLLTLVFEHHGIDLLGEDTTRLKESFNSASVARIGKKNQKAEHGPQVADTDDAPEPREVHMTDVGGQTQGEQQPHDGRFQPSLEDLYHRQYELEEQFRQFRSDNQATLVGIQSSLGDLHGKMDQVLHYFQHYPPPPQQPHDGRFQPSLHDLYHQFREFRSDNQSSLGDLHGKMDQLLRYFQHYPPPPPPPQP